MKPDADILFEASWEVCNKIGGIYTVVQSKASLIQEYYAGNYYLIGPYVPQKAAGEFSEGLPPDELKAALEELSRKGIICRFGKWLIPGQPKTILIDFNGYRKNINEVKRSLWDEFKVDSLRAPEDYNDPLIWAYCTGIVIDTLSRDAFAGKKLAAQFHEWLAGAGILFLKGKQAQAKVATIFTTHATALGRALSGMNIELHNVLDKINADTEAIKYNLESKHTLEKQSALKADIFTTVSETTAEEAGVFLGRKPEVLLYNGLEINKFPTFEEISIKHRIQRDKVREFLFYFFFPYYTFDIKETLFYFIAGRNEVRAKGIDIYIRALGELNKKLKQTKSAKTIVAFVWVPTNSRGVRAELMENKIHYQDIKDSFDDVKDEIHKNLIYTFVANKATAPGMLFEEEFLLEMKAKVARLLKKGAPDVSTHYIDEHDDILRMIHEAGLGNGAGDPVKIVYYPTYLSGADGLLNLTYYEAMQGSHLGVFPSLYEPWGYTPLEAGALGVSSVTSDLAGFGMYASKHVTGHEHGVFVLKRRNRSDAQVIADLVDIMLKFSQFSPNERISSKMHARHIAAAADWKDFVRNYIEAHNRALEKVK
ncbi:glycogen/starch synthase [Candidatus Woesearchaeota archaeon]|nr:glycogen/starch synthase [Candidatus Woesearchaeota archaeon]